MTTKRTREGDADDSSEEFESVDPVDLMDAEGERWYPAEEEGTGEIYYFTADGRRSWDPPPALGGAGGTPVARALPEERRDAVPNRAELSLLRGLAQAFAVQARDAVFRTWNMALERLLAAQILKAPESDDVRTVLPKSFMNNNPVLLSELVGLRQGEHGMKPMRTIRDWVRCCEYFLGITCKAQIDADWLLAGGFASRAEAARFAEAHAAVDALTDDPDGTQWRPFKSAAMRTFAAQVLGTIKLGTQDPDDIVRRTHETLGVSWTHAKIAPADRERIEKNLAEYSATARRDDVGIIGAEAGVSGPTSGRRAARAMRKYRGHMCEASRIYNDVIRSQNNTVQPSYARELQEMCEADPEPCASMPCAKVTGRCGAAPGAQEAAVVGGGAARGKADGRLHFLKMPKVLRR